MLTSRATEPHNSIPTSCLRAATLSEGTCRDSHCAADRLMGLNQSEVYKVRRRRTSELELAMYMPVYRRMRSVSKGSWGVTDKYGFLVDEGRKQRNVAITFVPRGARVTARLREDIISHHKLIHPHLTNIIEVLVTPSCLGIVKEYVEGCNLLQVVNKLGPFKEHQARWFFQQYASALDYLHRRDIAHKEIKLDTAIMSQQDNRPPLIKILGFKLAMHDRLLRSSTSSTRVYEYMAPEMWGKSMRVPYDGKASDMWALGVCLYYMLYGEYPFPRPRRAVKPEEAPDMLVLEFPDDPEVSNEGKNLMAGLMAYEKSDRLTIKDVFKDPWFLQDLPRHTIDLNDRLEREDKSDMTYILPKYRNQQTTEEVKEILEQARSTTNPTAIWSDTAMDKPNEKDDHQDQMMSPEECEDHVQVMAYPMSGKEILFAE